MIIGLFIFCFGLVTSQDYMTSDMTPNLGPDMGTVYQPGTSGGQWSADEVETTRQRILQMIHPVWKVKDDMGTKFNDDTGHVTENVLMRLAFHDCIPYTDGSGGCDGCMNWEGMYSETPNPNKKADQYKFDPVNATDNKGLDRIAEKLELIYTSLDWPFQDPSLDVSLYQSGKSRADLWQLAGLVALEQALERANRACDLDYHARQQVTLLESRDACEFKLTKPLKFLTGRKDCISDDPEGRAFVTTKHENHPKLFGDGNHIIDYGRNMFKVDAEHWMALQAIHGATHAAKIGLKYTWFGPGYISNMYFKMIANHPKYSFWKGGDLAFTTCITSQGEEEDSVARCADIPIQDYAFGDKEGNPTAQTGWRASCMYLWNTDEGGPCVLRPTSIDAFDNPAAGTNIKACVDYVDELGECHFNNKKICENAWCDENNIVHDGPLVDVNPEPIGPWTEEDKRNRHVGWNNQFAFPWEIGFYYNFTVGGVGQRAIGCSGLDEDFGTVSDPKWPYRNNNSPIWASRAMQCGLNDYAPEGKPVHEIIEELASDNEHFAKVFLDGWHQMSINGYTDEELVDGPQNAWMGYYSLSQQGIDVGDFEAYIDANAPVTFTDTDADPWVCGHRGHSTTSCGFKFSKYLEKGREAIANGETGCVFAPNAA